MICLLFIPLLMPVIEFVRIAHCDVLVAYRCASEYKTQQETSSVQRIGDRYVGREVGFLLHIAVHGAVIPSP